MFCNQVLSLFVERRRLEVAEVGNGRENFAEARANAHTYFEL